MVTLITVVDCLNLNSISVSGGQVTLLNNFVSNTPISLSSNAILNASVTSNTQATVTDSTINGDVTNNSLATFSNSTVHGAVTNNSQMNITGGTFTGDNVNNAIVTSSGSVTYAGTGLDTYENFGIFQHSGDLTLSLPSAVNSGRFEIGTSGTSTLNMLGTTYTNNGLMDLNQTVLLGSGSVNNSFGGIITGASLIASSLTIPLDTS